MYSTRSRQSAAVHRQLLQNHTPSTITSKSSTSSKSEQQEQPQQHQQQQQELQQQSQSQSPSQLSSLLELQSQTQLPESEILEIEKSSTIRVTNSSTQTAAHIANIINNNNNSKIVNNKNSKTDNNNNQLYYTTNINSNNSTSNNRIDAHSSNDNRNIGDTNNNKNNNNSRNNIRSTKNSNKSSVIVINKNRSRRFRGIKRSTTTTAAPASTTVTPPVASAQNAGIETPLASIGHYNCNNSYSGNNGNQPVNDVVLSHISGGQRMGRPSGLAEDIVASTAATTPTTQTQISTPTVTASPKFMSASVTSNINNNSGHSKNVATVPPMIRAHEQPITSTMYSYPVAGASTMSEMSTSDFAGSQRSAMHVYSSSTEHAPTNPMDEQARHLHRGRRARQRAKRLEAYHLRRSLKTMNKFLRKTVFTLRCIRALMLQQVQMTRALNSNMSLFD